MDTNERLDKITQLLELQTQQLQDIQDELQELREAVSDFGLQGSGYSQFAVPGEED